VSLVSAQKALKVETKEGRGIQEGLADVKEVREGGERREAASAPSVKKGNRGKGKMNTDSEVAAGDQGVWKQEHAARVMGLQAREAKKETLEEVVAKMAEDGNSPAVELWGLVVKTLRQWH